MDLNAPRNKFRGLQRHIAETYQINRNTDPAVIHAELNANGWAGVPLNSVQVAVYHLRRLTSPAEKSPDILLTIPLPKKQSLTLPYSEARGLYQTLKEIFG